MVTEPQTIEGFALSDQQEHLWLLQAGHDAAYHAQGLYLLEGDLDTDLLRRALDLVLSRHEILRTRFSGLEGMDLPLQIIASEARVPMEQLDLSGLADDAQKAQTDALYARLMDLPLWNADQLPLQTHLITLGPRRRLLLVRLPALCADAYALRNFMREIIRCYAACTGDTAESDESLQYVDYTQWQQDVTTAEGAHVGLKHWQQDWSGDRSSELPFTRLKGGEPSSFQPASISIDLDIEAVRRIQKQMEDDVSVRDVLFSSWLVLLWRLMGGEGLTVAAACDGRKYSGLHSAIGLYEKYLPIRLSLMGDQSMADVVREARAGMLDAYRFQDYFSWKALGESPSGSRQAPSVGFAFAYEVEGPPESMAGNLRISLTDWSVISDRFTVRLSCIERGDVLTGEIHYDRGRVSESDALRLGEEFRALMSSAAADPLTGIGTLSILSSEERDQLLVEWNATEADFPRDMCVHELFETAAHAHSDATALVFEEQQLTYAELNRRANQLAHYLRGLGVGPDVLVGLCLERSVDLIVGLLGILKAGGAYVPLDPALPQERRTWMLHDSGVKVLVTWEALAEVGGASRVCVCLDRDAHEISSHREHNPTPEVKSHHLVYVIYTSGSTGRPKAVGVEHRHLLNYVLGVSQRLGLKTAASYATVSTLAADLGNTMVFPSLCLGGCLHLISSERAMDAARFGEYLCSHRIDYLKIVPSHLWALLGEGAQPAQRLPREALVLGGEASSWELVAKIQEASPGLRVFNHYGPTETTVGVLTYAVELAASAQTTGSLTVPLGRALPNTQVYVLNACREPVPVGVVGELYIGGAGVSRGYLNSAELTQERFVSDAFSGVAGARLYRTGDLVRYLADGNVEFVGRADNQVKIRGFRIELGEIESVLLQHGGVREAVVVAREDVPGEKRLVGYVVGQAGSVSVSALRAHLGEKLPEYMVPSAWAVLEQLPLTSNGKVDRKALPAPEPPGQEHSDVAARTPVEEGLAQIWQEVLHLEQVGVHTSFFALGGHSLLATQVISRIRNTFAVELPLRALFEAPTIAGLAARIAASGASDPSEAPGLVRVSREARLPLSFAQQRLWFIDQLEPESSVYNIPMALRLSGSLDVAALEHSLQEIVLRHEALRTTFTLELGVPSQVIHEGVGVVCSVVDLSSLDAQEREREARRLITQEAQRPFDLAGGPVFRVGLLRLGEAEHVLLLTLHHIVSDAWSQGVLTRELRLLYNAFHAGRPSPLSELAIQYADYAAWQREWLQGEALERQVSYWKERLEGAPTLLELPTDRPRPPVQTFRGARARREFSAELTAGLKALGQREGATLFMTLLAAFQTLLFRYSSQDDLVVGTPIANRTRSEVEGVIGFFVNTLVLRADLSGDPSFAELLQRVREVCLGGYAHQDLPFEKLVEELQPERSLSHTPVFQVMFSLANAPGAGLGLAGVEVEGMGSEGVNAKFDLSVILSERSGALGGVLEYNTDLFDADRIERMLGHFEILLEGIVSDPQQKISRLPLLSAAEREQLVVEWNDTVVEYPGDRCVHELFAEQVERSPEAVAVVHEEEHLTYAQLNARANQLAHYLRKHGVGPEVVVGLCVQRSLAMVVGLLGILKAGGAYLPLDPSYPPERLAFMLQDAKAPVLLCDASSAQRFDGLPGRILSLDAADLRSEHPGAGNLHSLTTAQDLAYVMFTSGSTGMPKGVEVPHRAVTRLVRGANYCQLGSDEVILQLAPLAFDASTFEIWGTLLNGGRLVIFDGLTPSLEELGARIRGEGVTTLWLTAGLFHAMVESNLEDLQGVRQLLAGGDVLSATHVAQALDGLSGCRVINGYGPTENTTFTCCHPMEARSQVSGSIPIGRPISNTRVYVLDATMEPVPVGVAGELYAGGDGLARGYLKRPDLTAEKFVPDPFSEEAGARLYRSGDRVRYLPDGTLEFLGRIDQQVKVRGFRIELGEIESVLGQHPGIREVVVAAREDVAGAKRLVAYLVEETLTQVGALREYLQAKLPGYMIPSAFVTLASLPLTSNGKVDRKALPAPDTERPNLTLGYTAPSTPVEEALAHIWCEVLRLEHIGIHDNFFELGGDSILSIQIIARANAAGLRLTPRQVFQHQTIAGLASVAGTQAPLQREQGLVTGSVALTPIQHWFLEQERAEAHHFNQARVLVFRERVSPEVVAQAGWALLSHHDALRLRFVGTPQGWQQSNALEETHDVFSVVDLSDTAPQERSAAITAECTQLQASLNLSEGPLLRMCYFDLGAEDPARLFIVIHHLAVDGVSWRVLLEDLATGIGQLTHGEEVSLPAKTTSFQQWAQRLEEYARSSALLSELDYWEGVSRSSGARLPVDFASGANTVASQRVVRVSLDEEETRALLSEVPSVYHTQINDALLTALARSVCAWTGERSVLVDLEGHGREALFEEVDLSRSVGWFTSLYPVLLELPSHSDWGESVKCVKERLRGVPKRGFGYGLLRYLASDAAIRERLGGGCEPQISFNYHGHFGTDQGDPALLGDAPEPAGPVHSPQALRTHLLDIIGHVKQGRLHLAFFYSEAAHARSSVEGLAQSYLQALRELISHCQSPQAGGYTPSDFPKATLSQQALDRVLASVGPTREDRIEDIYALSPMQAGMLFHSLYATEHAVYLDHQLYTLHCDIDPSAFERAWQVLIARHSLLRTSFHWEGLQDPVQVVHRSAHTPLDFRDWRHLTPQEHDTALASLRHTDREQGMDLSSAPLMRLTLVRTGSHTWQFLCTIHHLIIDRWSVALLVGELTSAYEAIRQGHPIELPVLRPYADYIDWLQQQDVEQAQVYWREVLAGFTRPTALPVDKNPGAMANGHIPQRQSVRLSEEVSSGLQALARQHHLTLNTLVAGAWALLLSRYSGEADVLLGATVSGRPGSLSGVEWMVGMFINSLPVRVRVCGQDLLLDWLHRLQESMLELREYEYSSLTQIQSWSDVPRGIPLFDSLVVVQNTPAAQPRAGGGSVNEPGGALDLGHSHGDSSVDFPLYLTASSDREMRLALNYDVSRYNRDDVERMLGHLCRLLEGMVADAHTSLDQLPMLPEVERHQVLVAWNDTATDYPRSRCVHELFEEQVVRTPDAVAVIYGEQRLTYSELNRRANQLAHYLQQHGVRSEVLVGLCVERSLDLIVGMLGILKAGGAYLPLDLGWPRERLDLVMANSRLAHIVTHTDLLTLLPESVSQRICLDRDREDIARQSEQRLVTSLTPANLAYVLHTSGSTGTPKGVQIPHRAVVNFLCSMALSPGMTAQDTLLAVTTLSFDIAGLELYLPLIVGARVVVASREEAMDGPSLAQRLLASGATAMQATPITWRMLRASGWTGSRGLKVLCGGEALPPDLAYELVASCGEVWNLYGPTETTIWSSAERLTESEGPITIGRPIANTQIYLLDANRSPVPAGVPGELYIGGDGMARGYLNRADLTAERFVADPFSNKSGARLYRTGDLARYLPDGKIECLGRLDHQVKVRGFRIELGEIESVLLSHPGVREAVVLAREYEPGEKRLVGYAVSAGEVSATELREHLRTKLPDYMIPSSFVLLEALPLTSNGKVDRKALPAPEPPGQEHSDVAARTPVEEGLAQIWQEVLHLEQVGVHTSFFALGGHSLLATQVISRIRNTFAVELPLRALFEAPTIAGLAARIAASGASDPSEAPGLVRVSREARLPLSFAQQRLWFIDQLEPESSVYNIPMALRLSGSLDVAALEHSLQEIVLRHEALRTTFTLELGVPSQVIHEGVGVVCSVVDLSSLDAQEREREARRLITQEAQRPFDLAGGPVFRVGLLRLGEAEHVLLLTLHHIVSDAWSQGVLTRELRLLYNAFHAGRPSPLSELAIQYTDYAAWQREWLQGEALERQVSYWKERLNGAPTLLELPTDRPRPPVQTFRGARVRHEFSAELTAALKALGQREGTTLFMTLLAAFQTLLARYSHQEDVVVGTPIANRTRSEVEGVIGFFVNTLVLRGDLSGDPSFVELLGRVREVCLGGYAHQDLPFEKLVEELQPQRSLSHTPVFQVMFSLANAPGAGLGLEGVEIERLGSESVSAKFDLSVILSERSGALGGVLEYNTDLFDADRIERMLGHFEILLEGIVSDPQQKISRLPLLSAAEREQLVVEWNDTVVEYPGDRCVHELFAEQVERSPEAVAVVHEEEHLTYAQLNARANQLAHYLRKHGVGPEVVVGLCVQRSLAMVVGLLGILKAGGAYLPLDPSYPPERLAFMLQDAKAPVLLSQRALEQNLRPTDVAVTFLDEIGSLLDAEAADNPASAGTSDHLAYVIYTSGSTGKPKGATITHRGLSNYLCWCIREYRVEEGCGAPVYSSIAFDLTVTGLYSPLLVGRQVVLVPAESGPESLGEALLAGSDYSLVKITPAHLELLSHTLPGSRTAGRTRAFIIGGEALRGESVSHWREYAPQTRIVNEYGPTETVVGCCVYSVTAGDCAPGAVPIGRPIANTQLYVLDGRGLPVPVGVTGELYIGGDGVGRGYLQRAELTAERFVPDPFGDTPGMRLYRTGDLVRYLPNGNLEYLGRLDNQVKIRGFRIELGEIESVLVSYSSVRDAVVLVREDVPGEKRLVGYVASATAPSVSELREHLLQKLPEYMIPSAFVTLASLPLTSNGKVDRKALPAPDTERPNLILGYTAPSTPVEEALAHIWCEVLRLEHIGIHDNFFELGGDSILSIQIIARANAAGLRLTPRQVFQHQTIAGLASVAGTQAPLQREQGLVSGPVALTPIQHWFFEQERAEAHHFNQARVLVFRERVSPEVVAQAAWALLSHHDALRLRFVGTPQGWQQSNALEETHDVFSVVDLSDTAPQERSTAITAECTRLQASLNLSEGPLLRMCYFDLGAEEPARLFIVIHHLGVDAVSWRVLLEDLATGIGQLTHGEEVSLPAKTTSFQQWAQRLEEYARSSALLSELDYWEGVSRSSGARLPVDFASGANTVASQRVVRVSLDEEETRALLSEVPSVYHTQINDALLTALARSVCAWTGERSVLVDLEGHGREALLEEVDLSRSVGWFTSLYPVLLELPSHSDWGESVKCVKERLRGVPKRGFGYGVLRYLSSDAAIRERLGGGCEPQISFNYHGHFGTDQGDPALLGDAPEPAGPVHSPQALRTHLLDIIGHVKQERLHLAFFYSEAAHARSSVEGLAQSYLQALRELISHCQSPQAGGYTPSDFPKATLSQQALDRVLASVGPTREDRIEDIYALSPMQAGMLFHSLYATEHAVYLDHQLYTLHCDIDPSAFERAWQVLIARHSLLRTSFHWEGLQDPVQVVHRSAHTPLDFRDWRHLTPQEHDTALASLRHTDREQGMDLSSAPLMRLTLMRTGSHTWQFLCTIHHLIIDRWSVALLVGELTSAYEAIRQGHPIELPVLRPYADYIDWLQQQDVEQAQLYWRGVLAGFTRPTALPVDKNPGAMANGHIPQRQSVRLSEEASSGLQALARQHHLTLNTLVAGAWALLLSRYSGEADVLLGATVSGRPGSLSGVEWMVGMFINSLPVRVRVCGQDLLLDWLHRLQESMLELREYEYSSLTQIQSWSDVPRGIPLFDSLVVVQNTPAAQPRAGGGSVNEPGGALDLGHSHGDSSVDFPLYLTASSDREMRLALNYDVSRYNRDDVERMLGHLCRLLEGMVADAHTSLDQLPMLPEAERHQVLVAWNDTATDYPRSRCVHELFEEQVVRTPDAVAVVYGDHRLTYSELNRRANQLAHYLQQHGVRSEVLVGLCVERSLDLIVGMMGILKAGGAYLPLDPTFPTERLALMLADANVQHLVTQKALVPVVPFPEGHARICLDADDATLATRPDHNPHAHVTAEDLAYVIYTSGSTGLPKGVAVPHRAVNRLVFDRTCLRLSPHDRVAQASTATFDAATFEIWAPLLQGACLVGVSRETLLSSEALRTHLRESGISVMFLTTALFNQWVVQAEGIFSCLRLLLFGGEASDAGIVRQLLSKGGPQTLVHVYGPTESTTFASWYAVKEVEASARTIPIGQGISNTRLYVLDSHLCPVGAGICGELCLGGEGLARGYLNQSEVTAERFVPDPFSREPGARLYRTGDQVRWRTDGQLEFVGRIDQQVKIRGFRIELGEIETVLRQHASIREAVVLAREDAPGERRLVAYVLGAGGSVTASELREHLRAQLPEYMLPSFFVVLEALPLSPNGKVDRKALPAPEMSIMPTDSDAELPSTPIEEVVSGIWADVLGVRAVSGHQHFFDLGGHSLLATRVIARLRETFNMELPLRTLFDHPTVRGLAREIEAARSAPTLRRPPPIVPVDRKRPLPLSFAQQRLWLVEQMETGSNRYNARRVIRLRGSLNVEAMRRAIGEIVRRHDVLRTTFARAEGIPMQVISEPGPIAFPVIDVSGESEAERETEAIQFAINEARRPFDLTEGPVLRTMLVKLDEQDHLLLLAVHHIAFDAWSNGILQRELEMLYTAFAADLPSPLPAVPLQYADFAVWQREWMQGEVLEELIAFWQVQLSDAPSALQLPYDRPHPAVETHEGAIHYFVVGRDLTAGIVSLSRKSGLTLFMTLLAAYQTLLYRYSGQNKITVGTDVANRNQPEVEHVFGCFVNQLVLCSNLAGDPTVLEFLTHVREVCLGAYAHQELPFDLLVARLARVRESNLTPIFQAKFVLVNSVTHPLSLPGLTSTPVRVQREGAKFDLTLTLIEHEGELRGMLEYRTSVFDPDTIARMAERFSVMLNAMVDDPNQRISSLPLLADRDLPAILPSDFPDAGLTRQDLENIIMQLGGAE